MGNKSQIAGILSIISGILGGILWGFLMLLIVPVMKSVFESGELSSQTTPEILQFATIFYLSYGIVCILFGILSIVGGVFSLKRKIWGLALAGAIASLWTLFPCGIAAIVLVSMGKNEFTKPSASMSLVSPAPPATPITPSQAGPEQPPIPPATPPP